jgi:uncharacterized protein
VSPAGAGGEPELSSLHPRVRLLWVVGTGIRAIVWTALAAFLDARGRGFGPVADAFPGWLPPGWLPAGVAGVGLVLTLAVPAVRFRRWRYALGEGELWIRRGILIHRVSVIPYRRLQFVDTRQGPLERWLGLTELVVHTAAPGTSGRIPGLEVARAQALRARLSSLVPGDGDPEEE